jgi:raffinose/stachyose/melibiose transport system permease protein
MTPMTAAGPDRIGSGAAIRGAAGRRVPRQGLRTRLRDLLSFRWAAAAVIFIGWFVYYPIVDNFVVSTTEEDIFTGEVTHVGVRDERWRRFWRAIYFVPSAISITVTGLLFYFIYQPDIGLLDAALTRLGLDQLARPWLGDEGTAIYAIIAMSQWQGFGYSTLLFAIAIQKIPRELYDAAIIDGAGPLRRLWNVTFPLTREMTGLMVIVTVTGAFQVFNEVMVMTAGGPNNSSQVLGTWLYQQGFIENNFGYGAAIAAVIFLATLVTGAAQLWYTRRRRVQL